MALKPGILVKDGKQMGYPQNESSSYTAGDYISISQNEISVNREIPSSGNKYRIASYDTSGEAKLKVTKYEMDGTTVIDEYIVDHHDVTQTARNFDDRFTIKMTNSNWVYTNLIASSDHAAGWSTSWGYGDTKNFVETFIVSDTSGLKLITKSEMDSALSGKQDVLTAGDHITIDDGEIAVNKYTIPAGDIVYKVLTGDYNSGNTVYVDKYESNGTFIERVTASPSGYQSQDVDGFIRIYKEWNRWEITLLEDCKEQSAGYNYSVAPHNDVTENDFTFTVEQQLDDADLMTRGDVKGVTGVLSDLTTTAKTNLVAAVNELKTDKQDASDNNLQTTDKTIVGGINELKSGLTTLDTEVNGSAITYPYADVITINDAVPANLADCSVKVEPVQDLHGYDKPWVGGAGKNKLPLTVDGIKAANTSGTWSGNTYTFRGISFEVKTDADGNVTSIVANGTSDADFAAINITELTLPAGSYIISGSINGASNSWRIAFGGNIISYNGDSAFTLAESRTDTVQALVRFSGTTVEDLVFYPMIRLSTETDATFAPYTNECPISGHTESVVTRDGKNLLSGVENNSWSSSDQIKIANDKRARSTDLIAVEPSTQYTISATALSDKTLNAVVQIYSGYGANKFISETGWQALPYAFQTPNNAVCIDIIFKTTDEATNTADYIANAQLELGTRASAYTPYVAPHTATIQLGSTIYGGTVDFDSGVMTVTHKFATFDGSNDENWNIVNEGKCAQSTYIQGLVKEVANADVADIKSSGFSAISADAVWVGQVGVSISSTGVLGIGTGSTIVLNDWVSYLSSNPLEVAYELAAPTTIQLTPQQIQLLQGTNTLYASTGDISVTVNGVSGSIGALESGKQDKTDYDLDTTAKTVVGGINELKSGLTSVSDAMGALALQIRTVNSTDKAVSEENIKADLLANTADITHKPCVFDIRYSSADVVAIGSRVNAGFGSWIVFDLTDIKFYAINNNSWTVTTISHT